MNLPPLPNAAHVLFYPLIFTIKRWIGENDSCLDSVDHLDHDSLETHGGALPSQGLCDSRCWALLSSGKGPFQEK